MDANNILKVAFCFFIALALSKGENFLDKKTLHNHLLGQGDANIKPLSNQSETLNVGIQLVIFSIQGLDEKTQVLSTRLGIVSTWDSDTLRWNESEFGGASFAKLAPDEVWVPHFGIYNAVSNQMFEYKEVKVTVSSSGQSTWTGGGNFETTCSVDVTYYPFDVQICPIHIGEMYSSIQTFDIFSINNYVDRSFYVSNDVWDLTETKVVTEHFNQIGHSRLLVELKLSRRPGFYILNVIVPVVMLSFMNILSFKIPATSGERVGYCVSLFLTNMVLLGSISDSMPKVASVSFLQLYINVQLVMAMVVTTVSIIFVNTTSNWNGKLMPIWIRIVCCCRKKNIITPVDRDATTSTSTEEKKDFKDDKGTPAFDIKETINMVDGRLFILFLVSFVLINLTFVALYVDY